MPAESLLIFFISYVLFIIKPGPGQAFRIACVLQEGFWCAMSVRIGISTICTLYFVIVALSYDTLIEYFESASVFFKVFGGLYLIYLGVKSLRKQKQEATEAVAPSPPNHGDIIKFFGIGVVLSLSNPMDIVYFLSVLPNLVPLGEFTTLGLWQGVAIVFFTGIVIDALILTLVLQSKEVFSEGPWARRINLAAGLSFILIGAYFLFSALFLDSYQLNLL